MRKIFKRFASLLTIFILTIMSIVPVHASENTSVVNVTDDLAIQMAERFALHRTLPRQKIAILLLIIRENFMIQQVKLLDIL